METPTELNPLAETEDDKERKRLYEKYRDEVGKLRISNSESLDKAVLTSSAGGLALSLGFLKDFIPVADAKYVGALYGSWVLFTLAIALVTLSNLVSLRVLTNQEERGARYYLYRNEDAFYEQNNWDKVSGWLNHWSYWSAFVSALFLTTFFVSTNLRGANMADNKTTRVYAQDGAINLKMQPTGELLTKGLTPMPMQQLKPTPAPQPASSNTTPTSK